MNVWGMSFVQNKFLKLYQTSETHFELYVKHTPEQTEAIPGHVYPVIQSLVCQAASALLGGHVKDLEMQISGDSSLPPEQLMPRQESAMFIKLIYRRVHHLLPRVTTHVSCRVPPS